MVPNLKEIKEAGEGLTCCHLTTINKDIQKPKLNIVVERFDPLVVPASFILYYSNNVKPTAPVIIQNKKKIRFQLADSLKNKIPIKTAPVAPNPVQIA